MSEKNYLVNKRFIILTILALFIFFFLPYIFVAIPYNLEFDEVAFVNECYKTGKDIFKILFGFWLANAFWIHFREKDAMRHYNIKKEKIARESLFAIEKIKNSTKMKGNNSQFQEGKRSLRSNLIRFQQLINQIDADIKQGTPLDYMSLEFKKLEKCVRKTDEWLDSDEAVYGKPLDPETDNCISHLYNFFNNYK